MAFQCEKKRSKWRIWSFWIVLIFFVVWPFFVGFWKEDDFVEWDDIESPESVMSLMRQEKEQHLSDKKFFQRKNIKEKWLAKIIYWNVKNYFTPEMPSFQGGGFFTGAIKSEQNCQIVAEVLADQSPDIVILVEMGGIDAVCDLIERLKSLGEYFFEFECLTAPNSAQSIVVLSKFHILKKNSQQLVKLSSLGFMRRGILDVEIEMAKNSSLRLLGVHLKSPLQQENSDSSQIRLQEALALRNYVDQIREMDKHTKLLVVGDMNDTPDSLVLRTIQGKNSGKMELNSIRAMDSSGLSWTFYHGKSETWKKVDYFLENKILPKWTSCFVVEDPRQEKTSDHRALVLEFKNGG